jgi:hypothetical protein
LQYGDKTTAYAKKLFIINNLYLERPSLKSYLWQKRQCPVWTCGCRAHATAQGDKASSCSGPWIIRALEEQPPGIEFIDVPAQWTGEQVRKRGGN